MRISDWRLNVCSSDLVKPQIIAKIERAEAIPMLREILDASDGIMVARGDLAVEVGNAAVPALQKRMIKLAREVNKIPITETQMVASMKDRKRVVSGKRVSVRLQLVGPRTIKKK